MLLHQTKKITTMKNLWRLLLLIPLYIILRRSRKWYYLYRNSTESRF